MTSFLEIDEKEYPAPYPSRPPLIFPANHENLVLSNLDEPSINCCYTTN